MNSCDLFLVTYKFVPGCICNKKIVSHIAYEHLVHIIVEHHTFVVITSMH